MINHLSMIKNLLGQIRKLLSWVVHRELTRTLKGSSTLNLQLDLTLSHKFIIFSDQHMGTKDNADDFKKSEDTYIKTLEYYLDNKYSLILLGDVEELWEQGFNGVEKKYQDVLQLEARFPPNGYYRIWGNHDDYWMNHNNVNKHLSKYMPNSNVYEAIHINVISNSSPIGTILMAHGHQGSFESDIISGLSRLFVRFLFRPFQRLTGISLTTPAKDFCLREKHDKDMYKWAVSQHKLILITGHTHRPVWTSRTHLQKLNNQLDQLKSLPPTSERLELIEEVLKQVAKRKKEYKKCDGDYNQNDITNNSPSPTYFNAGCCCYPDGDITGIEIEDGILRLIKWPKNSDSKEILEEERLINIFNNI